jgi:hypothetical protein
VDPGETPDVKSHSGTETLKWHTKSQRREQSLAVAESASSYPARLLWAKAKGTPTPDVTHWSPESEQIRALNQESRAGYRSGSALIV